MLRPPPSLDDDRLRHRPLHDCIRCSFTAIQKQTTPLLPASHHTLLLFFPLRLQKRPESALRLISTGHSCTVHTEIKSDCSLMCCRTVSVAVLLLYKNNAFASGIAPPHLVLFPPLSLHCALFLQAYCTKTKIRLLDPTVHMLTIYKKNAVS